MKLFIFAFVVLMISLISAECNETQVDINSASLEDMMKITGLGGTGATAQKVIDARPFSSLDDLTRVSGIKEGKLSSIKSQGLACINEDDENAEIENQTADVEINASSNNDVIVENVEEKTNKTPQIIKLNADAAKDIKSGGNSEQIKKNAVYGLVIFCIFLGLLLALKIKKGRTEKNEF